MEMEASSKSEAPSKLSLSLIEDEEVLQARQSRMRAVVVHRLHVTEEFLDGIKEAFRSSCHYAPAKVNHLRAMVHLSDKNEIVIASADTNYEMNRFLSNHVYSAKRVLVWESGHKGHIVTMSSDSIRSRDFDNKNARQFPGHKSRLTTISVSDEESYENVRIISGSASGTILVHSLKSAKILFVLNQHKASVSSLCFSFGIGQTPLVASVDSSGVIILWENDSESMNILRTLGNESVARS
jgi:hypothetical protein